MAIGKQGILDEVLIEQARVANDIHAAELDKRCKAVAGAIDSTRLASVNGLSYQYIRAMLNTNSEQKPWRLDLIPALAIEAPDLFAEYILSWLCELCGREVPPKKRVLTSEEELSRIKETIRMHGLDPLFKGLV